MRILLVDVDTKIPNLALHKLKKYHEDRGDVVTQIRDRKNTLPITIKTYDKIYVSCIFDYHKRQCQKWEGIAEIGGSGYSITKKLPDEIEEIKPRINQGFTTRGCIRNCYFCVVPKKEGMIRAIGDVYDLWDGKSKQIIIMDNNILALPKHFMKVSEQIKKENLIVDFNQGLDFRLLTDEICIRLLSLKHRWGNMRFAYDDIAYTKSVLKALKMLEKHGLKKWSTRWYVYVGTKDTVDTVVQRVNLLRECNQLAFVMCDRQVCDKSYPLFKEFQELYAYSSAPHIFVNTPYYPGVMKAKISREIRKGFF